MVVAQLVDSRSWRLAFDAAYGAERLSLRIGEDSGLEIILEEQRLIVDRRGTRYPHGGRRVVSLTAGEANRVEVVHDRSITEIFVGDGDLAFTLRSFVAPDSSGAVLIADGPVRLGPVAAVHFD